MQHTIAPNVLDRHFDAAGPNLKWAADFTYIWTTEGWLYVAVVLDLFSRRVVGWSMSSQMTAQLVTDAMLMAIWRRGPTKALLHHSDQGSQYFDSDAALRPLRTKSTICRLNSGVYRVVVLLAILNTSKPNSGVSTKTSQLQSASVGPCTYGDGSTSNSSGTTVSPSGSATPSPTVAGTYLFTLTCGSGADTLRAATLAAVLVNARTRLSSSVTSAPVDAPVTLNWSSAGGICYATRGDGNAPWIGTLDGTGSGSLIVTSPTVGSITYGVTCNNQAALTTVNYVAVPATSANAATPSVTLSSSDSTETAGQSVSLEWSSKNAVSCSAAGGNPGDGWTGSLGPSGSMTLTETSAGTVTYSITCAGAPPAATTSTSVIIVTAAAAATGSSHGEGSLDPLLLWLLSALVGASIARAEAAPGARAPLTYAKRKK